MPIDLPTLFAFALVAGATVVSPGPDTMLIIRNTVTSGTGVGIATVIGVQVGLVVHTAFAVFGLSVLIVSIPPLFQAMAIAGAIYLGWLGVQSFRFRDMSLERGRGPVGTVQAARDALLTNLLNPKVIMLFLALMPGFVEPARGAVPMQLIALALTLLAINVLWQVPVALGANAIRVWLNRPAVQRGVSYATGAVLLFFAGLLIVEHGL